MSGHSMDDPAERRHESLLQRVEALCTRIGDCELGLYPFRLLMAGMIGYLYLIPLGFIVRIAGTPAFEDPALCTLNRYAGGASHWFEVTILPNDTAVGAFEGVLALTDDEASRVAPAVGDKLACFYAIYTDNPFIPSFERDAVLQESTGHTNVALMLGCVALYAALATWPIVMGIIHFARPPNKLRGVVVYGEQESDIEEAAKDGFVDDFHLSELDDPPEYQARCETPDVPASEKSVRSAGVPASEKSVRSNATPSSGHASGVQETTGSLPVADNGSEDGSDEIRKKPAS